MRGGLFDVLTGAGLAALVGLCVANLVFGLPVPVALVVVVGLGTGVAAKVAGDDWGRVNDLAGGGARDRARRVGGRS